MKNTIPKMTDPDGKNWPQPQADNILIDDYHALMTQSDFNQLIDYSHSVPSGVYPGKMWKTTALGYRHRLFCDDTREFGIYETQKGAGRMTRQYLHTNDEADNLCAHYRRKGYNPVKSLNINPQYFDVTVYLPVVKYLKPTPRAMVNRMWR